MFYPAHKDRAQNGNKDNLGWLSITVGGRRESDTLRIWRYIFELTIASC